MLRLPSALILPGQIHLLSAYSLPILELIRLLLRQAKRTSLA